MRLPQRPHRAQPTLAAAQPLHAQDLCAGPSRSRPPCSQLGLVGLKLIPGDVAGMGTRDEDCPFVTGKPWSRHMLGGATEGNSPSRSPQTRSLSRSPPTAGSGRRHHHRREGREQARRQEAARGTVLLTPFSSVALSEDGQIYSIGGRLELLQGFDLSAASEFGADAQHRVNITGQISM